MSFAGGALAALPSLSCPPSAPNQVPITCPYQCPKPTMICTLVRPCDGCGRNGNPALRHAGRSAAVGAARGVPGIAAAAWHDISPGLLDPPLPRPARRGARYGGADAWGLRGLCVCVWACRAGMGGGRRAPPTATTQRAAVTTTGVVLPAVMYAHEWRVD